MEPHLEELHLEVMHALRQQLPATALRDDTKLRRCEELAMSVASASLGALGRKGGGMAQGGKSAVVKAVRYAIKTVCSVGDILLGESSDDSD